MGKNLTVYLLAGVLTSTVLTGCVEQQIYTNPATGNGLIIIHQLNTSYNPKYIIASNYHMEEAFVNATASQYLLPLNLTQVVNIQSLNNVFQLTENQQTLLKNNGFVVIDYGRVDDIVQPYTEMKEKGIPIFVTTDTLLHLYHIQFDEILKSVEEKEFFDDILDVSKTLFERAKKITSCSLILI